MHAQVPAALLNQQVYDLEARRRIGMGGPDALLGAGAWGRKMSREEEERMREAERAEREQRKAQERADKERAKEEARRAREMDKLRVQQVCVCVGGGGAAGRGRRWARKYCW